MKIKLFTDSIPTLDSIASTKQVKCRLLRNSYTELKERLEHGEIYSYSWLDSEDMIADILTKEHKDSLNKDVLEIVTENRFKQAKNEDNLVIFDQDEIVLKNRKEKEKKSKNEIAESMMVKILKELEENGDF